MKNEQNSALMAFSMGLGFFGSAVLVVCGVTFKELGYLGCGIIWASLVSGWGK